MKTKTIPFTRIGTFTWILFAILGLTAPSSAETVQLYFDPATPQIAFAAGDVKAALEARKFTVEVKELSALTGGVTGKKVVIALASDSQVAGLLETQGGGSVKSLGEQAHALRTTTASEMSYWVLGGDDNGAMYGALQIAENIKFKGMADACHEDDAPHLKNRGIKFNVPLDEAAPTYFYDFCGTAHRKASSVSTKMATPCRSMIGASTGR